MGELNKGFEPFQTYNHGNDYNPLGYGTARVMRLSGDSIFAMSGIGNNEYVTAEFDVVRAITDTSFNKDTFINGVWHATSDSEGGKQNPSVVSYTMNLAELNNIEEYTDLTSLDISAKINKGSVDSATTTIKLVAGTSEVKLYTTTDTDISISITDSDLLDTINELVKNGIEFKIVTEIADSKSSETVLTQLEKTVKSVHYCYYGWLDESDITPENISVIDVKSGKCAKTVDYLNNKSLAFGAFYPQDQSMYIAIPKEAGLVERISNGAAVYTIGTSNTDFIYSTVKINDVDYYLYVLQYINHGTYDMLVKLGE